MKPPIVHTRPATLARVRREYAALARLRRSLDPGDLRRVAYRDERGVAWTVKDLLAHVAQANADVARSLARMAVRYERIATDALPRKIRGRVERIRNREIHDAWRRRPLDEIVRAQRAGERVVLAALRAWPASYYTARSRPASWPFNVDGHSALHRHQVEHVLRVR